MDDQNRKDIVVMECPAHYSLCDDAGGTIATGPAHLRLCEEDLSVIPRFSEPLFFPLRDILELRCDDYRITLQLPSQEHLTLHNLGYKYEDFARILARVRNEVILKDMLMHETLRKTGVGASLDYHDPQHDRDYHGTCEVRLYETGFVVIPENSDIVRCPYSEIATVHQDDVSLTITTEYGATFTFHHIGTQFDSLTKTLSLLMNELSLKVQATLREILPEAEPSVVRRAARYMRDGKAAKKSDIESVSPALWRELEKRLETVGIKEEYDFLKHLAQQERLCIGFKRGLMGDITGEYLWFLAPMYSIGTNLPGNALAMEATSGEDSGRATYFFRITSRKTYPNYRTIDELHRETDQFITAINRCMLAINFRREPVYLPDHRLNEPRYHKYRYSVLKIPELRVLRERFIGRVIHSSLEQWKNDVMDLLRFNTTSSEDTAKWKSTA